MEAWCCCRRWVLVTLFVNILFSQYANGFSDVTPVKSATLADGISNRTYNTDQTSSLVNQTDRTHSLVEDSNTNLSETSYDHSQIDNENPNKVVNNRTDETPSDLPYEKVDTGRVFLPVEDRHLQPVLDIALCRVRCPHMCWQSCLEVRNNGSLCASPEYEDKKGPRNMSLSLPCTIYVMRGSINVTEAICRDSAQWSVSSVSVIYSPTTLNIILTWDVAHNVSYTHDVTDKTDDVILVLYWRDATQSSWKYIKMYINKKVKIPVTDIEGFNDLDFLLVILNKECVLASSIIEIPNQVLHGGVRYVPPNMEVRKGSTESPVDEAEIKYRSLISNDVMADQGNINEYSDVVTTTESLLSKYKHFNISSISIDELVYKNGTKSLSALAEWILPKWLVAQLPSRVSQRLSWARDTCRANRSFSGCDIAPSVHNAVKVTTPGPKIEQYTLTSRSQLTYNSKYWMTVRVNDYITERFHFTTPGCLYPTSTFTRCLPAPQCTYNNSCDRKSDFLSWEINLTCWQTNVDSSRKDLLVLMSWSEPITDGDIVSYRISLHRITDTFSDGGKDFRPSKSREIHIKIRSNSIYEIRLLARVRKYGKESSVFSQVVHVNTSTEALQEQWPRCQTIHTSAGTRPWVITLAILGGFLAAVFTVLLLYKKRHSFRDIIITKATVVKSNSYKSTLGAYSDIKDTKQLRGNKEDWEVDPLQVSLGSELGQGAFGRVLTGQYEGEKVAIKILKEGSPFFQRDDLLREILVMKNIGSHPHIISFIGACTLREPIALIMEYMPFGNLQQFLKRCRRDGDLEKTKDGCRMHYEIVDEVGAPENWDLTPRDFLSFARQIAMAMEYLSERQYVHRDLAARNVLVGVNKAVKLCDFGLARLVYSEDQYYRLTGGRLPVRWMALESLRDRMYTTQSDVWAYGIFLWEVVTFGCCPYPNITLGELFAKLCEGYRMEQPKNCSDELYDLMSQCWCETPSDRPTFTQLRTQLETLLTQNMNYLVLDNIDLSCETSDASENTAIFDISMESLVTDQEVHSHQSQDVYCACASSSTSLDGAGVSELHQCLLHHSPGDACANDGLSGHNRTNLKHKNNCKSHCSHLRESNRTFSTWSLQSEDLKLWLKMHTLTKSTLSLADLQDGFSDMTKKRSDLLGSTNSEIHTISTIV